MFFMSAIALASCCEFFLRQLQRVGHAFQGFTRKLRHIGHGELLQGALQIGVHRLRIQLLVERVLEILQAVHEFLAEFFPLDRVLGGGQFLRLLLELIQFLVGAGDIALLQIISQLLGLGRVGQAKTLRGRRQVQRVLELLLARLLPELAEDFLLFVEARQRAGLVVWLCP